MHFNKLRHLPWKRITFIIFIVLSLYSNFKSIWQEQATTRKTKFQLKLDQNTNQFHSKRFPINNNMDNNELISLILDREKETFQYNQYHHIKESKSVSNHENPNRVGSSQQTNLKPTNLKNDNGFAKASMSGLVDIDKKTVSNNYVFTRKYDSVVDHNTKKPTAKTKNLAQKNEKQERNRYINDETRIRSLIKLLVRNQQSQLQKLQRNNANTIKPNKSNKVFTNDRMYANIKSKRSSDPRFNNVHVHLKSIQRNIKKKRKVPQNNSPSQKFSNSETIKKTETKSQQNKTNMPPAAKIETTVQPPDFEPINLHWNIGIHGDRYGVPPMMKRPRGKHTCEKWQYDPAEYTLTYYSAVSHQDEPCSYPHNETVKKIVKSNKDIVWKGCTQETPACTELPHFNFKRNVRVNVPPCCRQHLLDMLKHFDEILLKYKVNYIAFAGTILGWYRNKQIIPYDNDLDVIMDGSYWKTEVWDNIFNELNTKYGYHHFQTERYKIKLVYSKINNITIDIWPYFNVKLNIPYGDYSAGEDVVFIHHSYYTACKTSKIFPPKRTTLNGVPVNVPRDPVYYLNKNYGHPKNWLIGRKCSMVNESGQCIS